MGLDSVHLAAVCDYYIDINNNYYDYMLHCTNMTWLHGKSVHILSYMYVFNIAYYSDSWYWR